MNKPGKDLVYLWHTNWPDGQERFRITQEAALSAGLDYRSRDISDIREAEDAIVELKRTEPQRCSFNGARSPTASATRS